MAITDDLKLSVLQLEQFRQVLGINPYHFWQMRYSAVQFNGCDNVYTHYRWLGERGPGRFDFIQAIDQAERSLKKILDYTFGYNYVESETVRLIKPRQIAVYMTPFTLSTKYRRVIGVGKRTWRLINSVTFWTIGNPDPGENISFNVTLPEAMPACEVKVCYHDTQITIEPVTISIAGLTATIVIKRWMLGKPSDWETGVEINADSMANLINEVDVYHVWLDPSQQINLAWEPDIYRCGCGSSDCPVCSLSLQAACASQGIYKVGVISWQPATYANAAYTLAQLTKPRFPDMAFVNYAHGLIDENCYVPMYWRRVITFLALSFLDTGLCGCADVQSAFIYWQEDLSKVSEKSTYNISQSDMENPLGRRRGAINAWNAVKLSMGDD